MDSILDFLISGGEEGIVIIDLDANWVAGHKGWRKMKKVRGVDYDLTCIGYEEGTGKYAGKVANLIFNWKDGTTIKCMLGKGWTHDMAEAMFSAIEYSHMPNTGIHPNDPRGSIFQVYALEESSKGKLRLAKVGEKRHDKNKADV
jgi:ATP-dependent DNA ligase